jgi:phage gp36-like protein
MYASIANFVAYFGNAEAVELSNLDGDPASIVINNGILEFNLRLASAEIDGFLPRSVISNASADNLMRLCLDITRYKLDKNRQREDVRLRYEDAIRQLEAMASGSLGTDDGAGTGDGDLVGAIGYRESQHIFTQESLRNYGRWR